MSDTRRDFYRAAVALTLVRKNYVVYKKASIGTVEVDLLVEKYEDGTLERFAVEISPLKATIAEHREFRARVQKLRKYLNIDVFTALVSNDGYQMKVDPKLKNRMLYSPTELKVDELNLKQNPDQSLEM